MFEVGEVCEGERRRRRRREGRGGRQHGAQVSLLCHAARICWRCFRVDQLSKAAGGAVFYSDLVEEEGRPRHCGLRFVIKNPF